MTQTLEKKYDIILSTHVGEHETTGELAASFYRLYGRTAHSSGRLPLIAVEGQELADRLVAGGVLPGMFTVIE